MILSLESMNFPKLFPNDEQVGSLSLNHMLRQESVLQKHFLRSAKVNILLSEVLNVHENLS